MRAFALVLVAALILFSESTSFYLKKCPPPTAGTASTQAIILTGLRMDLLQIAQAARNSGFEQQVRVAG